jgi:hypothetical protein
LSPVDKFAASLGMTVEEYTWEVGQFRRDERNSEGRAPATKRRETNRDDRSRLERFLDPFDVAGRAIRLVPGTPPCALAHVDF